MCVFGPEVKELSRKSSLFPVRNLRTAVVILLLTLSASATDEIVQEILVHGQRRIRAEVIRSRMSVRPGDVFDQSAMERDFHSLWNTGYFEDLQFERENTPKGCVLHIYVREKPNIREIKYDGLTSVSISDVVERLKDRKVTLSSDSPYDPAKVKRAAAAIQQLLAEHGRQFATVRTVVRQIPPASVGLRFIVEEGPKVKVGRIKFEGNRKLKSTALRSAMKNLRPIGIPRSVFLENLFSRTYDGTKLNEDTERVRMMYQEHGYFRAVVEEPKTTGRDYNPGLIHMPLIQKSGKRVDLAISVKEGERYTLKAITFSGNQGISNTQILRSMFPLKDGGTFNTELIRKGLDNIRNVYGELGYINATAVPNTTVDDDAKQISLEIDIDEGKSFHVRRIEFRGNTRTRDKVVRRELALDEGSVYNSRLLNLSLLRLNQLSYFEPLTLEGHESQQSAEIKQNPQDGTIDITLKVKEKGQNSIGLNGGVSGLAGSFAGISYETNNFLGLGETLRVQASVGNRQRNFLIGFTEPYIFDRPYSLGATVFDTQYRFNQEQQLSVLANQKVSINPATRQNYTENSKGGSVSLSHLLRKSFTRVGLTYSYSVSNIDATTNAAEVLFQNLQYRSLSGPSALEGIRSSKIIPSISYSTVDNPMYPTRGKSFDYTMVFEGAGGNTRSISQVFEAKYFRPVNRKRNVLAFRLQSSFTTGYGGVGVSPTNRFYTGGDDSVRGFDIRSISPVAYVPVMSQLTIPYSDPNILGPGGSPLSKTVSVPVLSYTIVYPGGDTQVVANAEYRIPLAGPVSLSLFADAGINGILRRSQLKLDPDGFAQLQAQFPNSYISDSLELLPRSNFRPRTSTGVELLVQLPMIQAPLRLYWAFNPTLYSQTVTAPANSYYLPDAMRSSLPPGVYEQQIVPYLNDLLSVQQQVDFHERRSTFRFSVSRTF